MTTSMKTSRFRKHFGSKNKTMFSYLVVFEALSVDVFVLLHENVNSPRTTN